MAAERTVAAATCAGPKGSGGASSAQRSCRMGETKPKSVTGGGGPHRRRTKERADQRLETMKKMSRMGRRFVSSPEHDQPGSEEPYGLPDPDPPESA
eukprot:scaffold12806_cov104-Isochrysis_galbana.AAC.3